MLGCSRGRKGVRVKIETCIACHVACIVHFYEVCLVRCFSIRPARFFQRSQRGSRQNCPPRHRLHCAQSSTPSPQAMRLSAVLSPLRSWHHGAVEPITCHSAYVKMKRTFRNQYNCQATVTSHQPLQNFQHHT